MSGFLPSLLVVFGGLMLGAVVMLAMAGLAEVFTKGPGK